MGLFFYTKKGSIISTVDLPTTEIIEPFLTAKKSQPTGWEKSYSMLLAQDLAT